MSRIQSNSLATQRTKLILNEETKSNDATMKMTQILKVSNNVKAAIIKMLHQTIMNTNKKTKFKNPH